MPPEPSTRGTAKASATPTKPDNWRRAYIGEAIGADDPRRLEGYPRHLEEEFGLYYKMARIFVKLIGNPTVMRSLAHAGIHSRPLMEWTLKVMSNLLDEDEKGAGERAYNMLAALVKPLPVA